MSPRTRTDVKVKIDAAARRRQASSWKSTVAPRARRGAVQLTFEGEAGKSAPVKLALDRFAAVPEAGATDSARAARCREAARDRRRRHRPRRRRGLLPLHGEGRRADRRAGRRRGTRLEARPGPRADRRGRRRARRRRRRRSAYVVPKAGDVRRRHPRPRVPRRGRLHLPAARRRRAGRHGRLPARGASAAAPTERPRRAASTSAPSGVTAKRDRPRRRGARLDGAGAAAAEAERARQGRGDRGRVPVGGGRPRRRARTCACPARPTASSTKPNEAQTARFAAKKGERLVVEVLARRAGSPVDPVDRDARRGGQAGAAGGAALRPRRRTSTFRDHDSAGPGIRLDAWNELAIDDYLYVDGELMRILALPQGPGRRLPVLPGRRASGSASSARRRRTTAMGSADVQGRDPPAGHDVPAERPAGVHAALPQRRRRPRLRQGLAAVLRPAGRRHVSGARGRRPRRAAGRRTPTASRSARRGRTSRSASTPTAPGRVGRAARSRSA